MRTVACAVLLVCFALASPVASATSAPEPSESQDAGVLSSSLEAQLVTPGSPLEAEQVKVQEEVSLQSPIAVAEREASQTKFESLTASQAANVDGQTYTEVLNEPAGGPPKLVAGQHIQKYVSDFAAQVQLGESGQGVVESIAPMAVETSSGQHLPVELNLTAVGNVFEPRRPVTEVHIPKQLGEGVRLAESGISVTPLTSQGTAVAGSEGIIDGATVLFANTQTDTDAVIKPTTEGFAADTVLRSVESPHQLAYRISLPSGASLVEAESGAIEIVKEQTPLATILPAYARDATGTAIPVSMSVTGNVLTVELHATTELQYPVEVDPEFIKTSDSQLTGPLGGKRSNWKFATTSETNFGHEPNEGVHKYEGEGKGYLRTSGTAEYKETEYAFWSYKTQGVSKIYEFNAHTEGKNKGAQIESFLELEGSSGSENKYRLSTETFEPEYSNKETPVGGLCAKNWATKVVECAPAAGAAGNTVRFQQSVQKKPTSFGFTDILHEGTAYIAEPEGTHSTTKFNTTSKEIEGEVENAKKEKEHQKRPNVLYGAGSWLSNFQGALEPIAEDPGIGVAATKLEYESSPGKWIQVESHNYLTENGCLGIQCYPSHPEYQTLPESLPNGEYKIRYRAEEAVGGTESPEGEASSTATVKVDTSKPHGIVLLGLPFGNELSETKYELTAEATDGQPSIASSGIKSITLYIDGKSVEDKEVKEKIKNELGEKEGECFEPRDECTATAKYTINGAELGAGHHSIQIVATDNAGNEGRIPGEGTEISIRHSTPVQLGPGSVDLESGDYAMSSTDVSMGSGLTVSRAYSSRALNAGAEGPLGPQWTLSLASATSLLEMTDGSLLMTAANGSQTIFAAILNSENKPTGKFEAPQGDSNLELTLEENEKKEKIAYYLKNAANKTTVKFTRPAGGNKAWMPTRQEGAVKTDTVTYTYQTVEVEGKKITEPTEALAPVPAGVECPVGKPQPGCRVLKFTYATTTTAGELFFSWGEYKGHLTRVSYEGYNPATKAMTTTPIPVAEYAYDNTGRLREEWDPRISSADHDCTTTEHKCANLKTVYGYDPEGHVTAVTQPGQQPSLITYGAIPGDEGTGRVLKVTQPPASTGLTLEGPTNTEAPKMAEQTPVDGVAISVGVGKWSAGFGKVPYTYSFQWEHCTVLTKKEEEEFRKSVCTALPGAINSQYKPTIADVGDRLRAKVTAYGASQDRTATSNESAIAVAVSTEYGLGGTNHPWSITTGPDGNLWITYNGAEVQKMSPSGTILNEYLLGKENTRDQITPGPDGNMWLVRPEASKVAKITTAGTVTEYSLPAGSQPYGITAGPNKENALWVTEWKGEKVAKITTSGEITQYTLPTGGHPTGITAGPEGNLWLGLYGKEPTIEKGSESRIVKLTTAGHVAAEYSLPSLYPEPESIAAGPDGNLWFTASCDEPCDIWKINSATGKITGYKKPKRSTPSAITVGPEGDLWYSGYEAIGRISTAGALTEVSTPEGHAPEGMTLGPDGNMWVPEYESKVAKVVPNPVQGDSSAQPGSTIEYNTPLSGPSAPHQLGTNNETGRPEPELWGQTDDPESATAIIAPDSPQGWPATSYKRAIVYYMDWQGRVVNIAQPSTATAGSISTTEYNEENDVVRTLTADNRATALAEGCESKANCKSATAANLLSTISVYNEPNQYGEAAGCRKETANPEKETAPPGSRLCETWGPQHEIRYVPNGYKTQTEALARDHKKYFYEDYAHGAPETVEGKKQSYDLVTETTDIAELEKGSEEEVESRKTTTSYAGQGGLGWTLRAPTSVTLATETGGAKLEHKTVYVESGEARGQIAESRGPKGLGGGTAHDKRLIYYTGEENTEGYTSCGKHPEWAGLVCKSFPAKQPTETAGVPDIPSTTTTYNIWDEPENVEETFEKTASFPTTTRNRVEHYDEAGRLTTSETTSSATTETTDKALPPVTDEYSEKTGLLEKQSTTASGKTQTVTTKYNTLAQVETYTDATGNIATYKYGGPEKDGLLEELKDSSNAKASSQKYTYDETTKKLTKLVDSAAGTFTASYDAEGRLTSEVYPNNMCANYASNAVGETTHVEYLKTSTCTETKAPVWFSETTVPSVRGETMSRANTLGSQSYTYDTLGRLTETQETPTGEYCKTRTYTYDEEANRTNLISREPNSKKECATEGGTEEKHTYDGANRLIDSGIEYDPLGNIIKLPANDAEGHEIKSTFYADNAVATQEQNGTKNEYFLDPIGRTGETVTTAGTKRIMNHYDASGNAVAWTCEVVAEACSTSAWTRNIPGIEGSLTAVQTNGAQPVLQLHDLEGDIVATAADNTTETKLLSTYNSTEFGVPNKEKAPPPFAWLGAAGVASSLPSGVITYGATSYIPQTGRPLQSEQVEPPGCPGGSGLGSPYSDEIEPWVLQGAAREAQEAPGIGAAEEREAILKAAMATVMDPQGLMTGAEALTLAHQLKEAKKNLEYYNFNQEWCGEAVDPPACELYFESGENQDGKLAASLEECSHQVHNPGYVHGHYYTKTCLVNFDYTEFLTNRVIEPGWKVHICFSYRVGAHSITYSTSSWWCESDEKWWTFSNREWWEPYKS